MFNFEILFVATLISPFANFEKFLLAFTISSKRKRVKNFSSIFIVK